MIQTTIQNADAYASVHPRFAKALEALRTLAREPFEKGRHEVNGTELFINALEYDTKPESQSVMEAHRRYVDIMYLLEGEETIGTCNVDTLREITHPYDETGDALLAALEAPFTRLHMRAGDVAILLPEDAHAPGMDAAGTSHVKKLIAKVLL